MVISSHECRSSISTSQLHGYLRILHISIQRQLSCRQASRSACWKHVVHFCVLFSSSGPTLVKMSIPRTAQSDRTAIGTEMSDLELGKKGASVTVVSVDLPHRPILGRRKTTSDVVNLRGEPAPLSPAYEGKEDGLTKVGNWIWKIHNASVLTRYALYIIPIAALLSVPLVLSATVYDDAAAAGVRLLGLFIWIEMIWVLLWVSKLLSQGAPFVFQGICGVISGGIRKYTTVLMALEIPLSLFLWTISAFASSHVICVFNNGMEDA